MSKVYRNFGEHLALSNGYPSLVGRLKRDSGVRALSSRSSSSLIRSLKIAVTKDATTFSAQVLPYAYLVALFLKGDEQALAKALAIPVPNDYAWFNEMAKFLIQQAKQLKSVGRSNVQFIKPHNGRTSSSFTTIKV